MKVWVSNTSPLIFFACLNKLTLLRQLAPAVLIPEFVFSEFTAKSDRIAQSITAACSSWITVQTVKDIQAVRIAMADVHQGEAEAIVLAQESRAEFILLDDQDARRFATRCGLKTIGTLGLLLVAKKRGLIGKLQPEIAILLANQFRIKPKLISAILKEAGEEE